MSQYPTPNQAYFSGINYNPSFFKSSSGVSLQYATNNFLQRTGTNPTSIATQTTFSGSINVSSITATADSTIQGNLTVSSITATTDSTIQGNLTVSSITATTDSTIQGNLTLSSITATTDSTIQGNLTVDKLTTNNISSTILTVASPIINLNGSVVCNNSTGIYKFLNMNCPINQVFPTS